MKSSFPICTGTGVTIYKFFLGGGAADFTYATLAEKDGQPPAAHNVMLRAVRQIFKKFLEKIVIPPLHIFGKCFASYTHMCM